MVGGLYPRFISEKPGLVPNDIVATNVYKNVPKPIEVQKPRSYNLCYPCPKMLHIKFEMNTPISRYL